jgi:hypothetical protein
MASLSQIGFVTFLDATGKGKRFTYFTSAIKCPAGPSHLVPDSPRAQVNETGEGVQLALDVGAAGAEDDACCAGGLELGEAGS